MKDDDNSLYGLSFYPNPNHALLTIKLQIEEEDIATMAFYEINGQVVTYSSFENGTPGYWSKVDG